VASAISSISQMAFLKVVPMPFWQPAFSTFGEYTVRQAKEYLRERGIEVRL
jgi:hypothetical protein